MKDIKEILCDNLLELRKNAGITQKDLSNSLNVSDKSVSRWERGDSVPDLALLKKLAEFYNVSVDYLLTEQKPVSENRQKYNENILKLQKIKQITMMLLLICSVWFVGSFLYVYFSTVYSVSYWQIFVWCVPCSFAVVCITNLLWKTLKYDVIYYSCFIWTLLISLYLQLLQYNFIVVFIIGIPVQIAILLYYFLKK